MSDQESKLKKALKGFAVLSLDPEVPDVPDVDLSDKARRRESKNVNDAAAEGTLEIKGQKWNTEELQRDFEVQGFMAPYCVVRRRSDGKKGLLKFSHMPRWYYDFKPEE